MIIFKFARSAATPEPTLQSCRSSSRATSPTVRLRSSPPLRRPELHAAALQVASDAHEQAQDEVALAAKLAEAAADAEADTQAEAALAQVAAEEKAAAAAAELLRAQAVKAFNDAFSAVKTQDLEAERLKGPFDDSKHTLADLKLRFLIGAKVRSNAQCPSWQPPTLMTSTRASKETKTSSTSRPSSSTYKTILQ